MADFDRLHVVIAGAGVAAIETALALRELAEDRVRVTLLAPDREFVHRPPPQPGATRRPGFERYPLAGVAAALDAELLSDRATWVDRPRQTVHTSDGRTLEYDALVLCLGATQHRRYEHAMTIDEHVADGPAELIGQVAQGEIARLAFVVNEGMAWQMPLYELALACAAGARATERKVHIALLTSEAEPLDVFGETASRQVAMLLSEHDIRLVRSVRCEVPQAGRVRVTRRIDPHARHLTSVGRARTRSFDQVVTLPELHGPHIRGIPRARNGFLPIDPRCRVRGAQRVYAAGDATDFPVKHAGIAAQQAEVAASAIAALAGADVPARMFRARLDGMLLSEAAPLYLSAVLAGGHSFSSAITAEPSPHAAATVAAARLRPYLERV